MKRNVSIRTDKNVNNIQQSSKKPMNSNSDPGFPKPVLQIEDETKRHYDNWGIHPSLDSDDYEPASCTALQRAMLARERLLVAKRANAKDIRDELNRYNNERLVRMAEEAKYMAMKSKSRMAEWEIERRARYENNEKMRRQKENADLIEHGRLMSAIYNNKQAELERLVNLKKKMKNSEKQEFLPRKSSNRFGPRPVKSNTITPIPIPILVKPKQPTQHQHQHQHQNIGAAKVFDRNLAKLAAMECRARQNPPSNNIHSTFSFRRRGTSMENITGQGKGLRGSESDPYSKKKDQKDSSIRIRIELHALEKALMKK